MGSRKHHPLVALACLIAAIALFSVPLSLKYKVFVDTNMSIATSDMVPALQRMSTVWCEEQEITMGSNFNAYLFKPSQADPLERAATKTWTFQERMWLPKRTHEYWGFYFLSGSTFNVSVCSTYPGAAMSLIQGTEALRKCLIALQKKRRNADDDDDDESEESESKTSEESDPQSSTISSSEGVYPNETLGIHVCNNAVFHAYLRHAPRCQHPDLHNKFTHNIVQSDYYYFFFAANPVLKEITNDISTVFYLEKVEYSRNSSLEMCSDTAVCSLPLSFGSQDFVAVELATGDHNSTSWSMDTFTSRCVPRKEMYFAFYFSFALLLLVAAFQ